MKHRNALLLVLTLLFAVFMSIPYLIEGCGFFALFGFVPLLCMERIATLEGRKRVWMWHYSAFVLWNAVTTFWVCNATIGGGIFAVLANAFQMSLIFGLFRFSRKSFGGILPYVFLAAAWIAWERFYFDAEISWPWLVLGNAFARSISIVQWYEFTGSLGGSLWVWLSNLGIFGLMVALSNGEWRLFNVKAKISCIAGIAAVLLLPPIVSKIIFKNYEETESPLEVIIFQPNIDPYHKFNALSQREQNGILLNQIQKRLSALDSLKDSTALSRPLLLLAPETFTNDIVTGHYSESPTWNAFTDFLKDYPGVNMIFGASTYDFIPSATAPSHTARRVLNGVWSESHNSALMVDGSGRTEICHKNKLVVAVEKTPYPAIFCKIDDLLGGVMGRCVGQDSVGVLHCNAQSADVSVPVGCAVCYESVYGEYYTEYVRKGAEFMTIITNDAWWGDTPGYRQHLSYASLRAIETRRSIARCANTGISAFIDQRGRIVSESSWWKREILSGTVNRNDEITFFVSHGDIVGRVCTFMFVLLLLAVFVRLPLNRHP